MTDMSERCDHVCGSRWPLIIYYITTVPLGSDLRYKRFILLSSGREKRIKFLKKLWIVFDKKYKWSTVI